MSLEQVSPIKWEDYIKKSISDLRSKYPSLNLSQIAVKINLNRSTLTRLINEGIKPQLDNYIKIINGSGNGQLINQALSAYDETLMNSTHNHIQIAITEKNKNMTTPEVEDLLEDRDNFIAYLLASRATGTTEIEVTHVLGAKGIGSLKLMAAKGLLTENAEVFKVTNSDEILVRSFESIKHHLKTYAQHYKVEHVGKEINYVHSLSEGLSLEGVHKVQALHRNFHADLKNVMRFENNIGPIPMFSVAFCDTFTAIDFEQTNKGILQ
jgi:hypothetical protein